MTRDQKIAVARLASAVLGVAGAFCLYAPDAAEWLVRTYVGVATKGAWVALIAYGAFVLGLPIVLVILAVLDRRDGKSQ